MSMQLVSLERSTKAGGQDRIDHPRHAHDDIADDIANAIAGALVFAYSGSTYSAQQSFKDNLKLAEPTRSGRGRWRKDRKGKGPTRIESRSAQFTFFRL
jgi:hypothetical protein